MTERCNKNKAETNQKHYISPPIPPPKKKVKCWFINKIKQNRVKHTQKWK